MTQEEAHRDALGCPNTSTLGRADSHSHSGDGAARSGAGWRSGSARTGASGRH